jgi:hypothetical protein
MIGKAACGLCVRDTPRTAEEQSTALHVVSGRGDAARNHSVVLEHLRAQRVSTSCTHSRPPNAPCATRTSRRRRPSGPCWEPFGTRWTQTGCSR